MTIEQVRKFGKEVLASAIREIGTLNATFHVTRRDGNEEIISFKISLERRKVA
jgi:hypothetical protein